MRPGTAPLPSAATRIVAFLAALLVAILTVLAASPELHQRLHGHDSSAGSQAAHAGGAHADDDDGCAVTLFAQGLVLPLALLALSFAGRVVRALTPAAAERDAPAAPRFLLLPSQAPPLG